VRLHADAGRRPCAADGRHGDARVDWRALDRLVPDQFDKYWQHTLDFLKIARDFWPAFLAETNGSSPPRAATF
jgi:Inactivated superfamily I helicase